MWPWKADNTPEILTSIYQIMVASAQCLRAYIEVTEKMVQEFEKLEERIIALEQRDNFTPPTEWTGDDEQEPADEPEPEDPEA